MTTTSDVSIANAALDLLGESSITSFTDATTPSALVNRRYEQVRDAVLRAHPWNFALKRQTLALSASTPVFDFSYQFALPTDCLRILCISPSDQTFKVEGEYLLADVDDVDALYIARIEDPTLFDPLFVEALSTRLAHEMAYKLTQSRQVGSDMWELYNQKLAEARSIDAQEGSPQELGDGPWLEARL